MEATIPFGLLHPARLGIGLLKPGYFVVLGCAAPGALGVSRR